MNEHIHSYKNKFLFHTIPVIVMYFSLLAFFPLAILIVLDIASGQFMFDEGGITDILVTVFALVVIPILSSLELNMFPKIIIESQGLKITVFNFRWTWIEIPWDQIIDVTVLKKTYRGKEIWSVLLSGQLTIWHRLLNKRYRGVDSAALFITPYLENEDVVIEAIKSKVL